MKTKYILIRIFCFISMLGYSQKGIPPKEDTKKVTITNFPTHLEYTTALASGLKTANGWNVTAVAKGLGPSIYNADSSKVSGTDPEELARVKNNFLIGKLGLADGPALDAAIAEVLGKLGTSNRNKYRAVVYALLTVKFGKESLYL